MASPGGELLVIDEEGMEAFFIGHGSLEEVMDGPKAIEGVEAEKKQDE